MHLIHVAISSPSKQGEYTAIYYFLTIETRRVFTISSLRNKKSIMEASGYDPYWVEDPPDDLKCLICLCVARDPQQHPGNSKNQCGKIFCRECITKHKKINKRNKKCPNCHRKLTIFQDARSARCIRALHVKCDNKNNGCKWRGELGSLKAHVQSCRYALVLCTNKCNIGGRVAEFLRKDIKYHLANDCLRRQHICRHCNEIGEHKEMTTTHLDTCPKVRVHCPNADCGSKVIRCYLSTHMLYCQHEPMTCKYFAIGCNETPKRKELKTHEKDTSLHFSLSIEKNLELTQKVAHLEADMEALKSLQNAQQQNLMKVNSWSGTPKLLVVPCIIKLTNYTHLKNNDDEFYSPPFSYSGYKMCLTVYANGAGRSVDTHVSAYVHLMKGKHDDSLAWPFTGRVKIELLNQEEDKNHHKYTLTFPSDRDVSKRVMNCVKRETARGWGTPKLISHTDLDYNATDNTQYLKDNTLVFRVSVSVPDYKPWLDYKI